MEESVVDAQRERGPPGGRTRPGGEALLHPRVTRSPIEQLATLPAPRRTPDFGLTEREHDVLLAVAQGLSHQETAAELHLTKLGCRTGRSW